MTLPLFFAGEGCCPIEPDNGAVADELCEGYSQHFIINDGTRWVTLFRLQGIVVTIRWEIN
jgi:hypothetical protein